MATPCVFIACCSDRDPTDLVKQILGETTLAEPIPIIEKIKGYPWHIETKYYCADVYLCTASEKTIGNAEFAQNVQAVILHYDSMKENGFQQVQEWMSFITEFDAEIRMLVCDNCACNEGLRKRKAQEWCIKNNFELVELYPEEESDKEDDFPETTGIKRIIQALHAHMWPNLIMKDKPSFWTPKLDKLLKAEESAKSSSASSASENSLNALVEDLKINGSEPQQDTSKQNESCNGQVIHNSLNNNNNGESSLDNEDTSVHNRQIDALLGDQSELFRLIGSEDPGPQSFEKLFEQFHQMKEKAADLPFEERKVYAEKVAVAFWRAMGGDEEEIEGLDSD